MRTLPVLFVCGLLLAGPAAGQTPSDAPEPAAPAADELFIERVQVNVVNLVVWVTDKKGKPIHGLTKEDFELYENGKQVRITNFFEVETGKPVLEAPAELDPADPPAGPLPYLGTPEDQRLSLIVYVDNYNLAPANRNRVLNRLRRFLYDSVGQDDQVMVVSHDRSLHIRQPFTSDTELALSALDELEALSGNPPDRLKERLRALQEIEQTSDGLTALSEAHSRAGYLVTETEFTLRRLRELVQALSGLQGRKALLYVSDGLPMTPAEDLFIAVDERFPAPRRTRRGHELRPEPRLPPVRQPGQHQRRHLLHPGRRRRGVAQLAVGRGSGHQAGRRPRHGRLDLHRQSPGAPALHRRHHRRPGDHQHQCGRDRPRSGLRGLRELLLAGLRRRARRLWAATTSSTSR